MANLEPRELNPWIQSSVDLLAPPAAWEPNPASARARHAARLEKEGNRRIMFRRYLLAGALAVLLACVAIPTIPGTAVYAQQAVTSTWFRAEQLWNWVTIVRPGPRLLGRLADPMRALGIQHAQPATESVGTLAEAGRRAGFVARMPGAWLLSGAPRLWIAGPHSIAATLDVEMLSQALRRGGGIDEPVPAQWNGANLQVQIGTSITATWSNVSDAAGYVWPEVTLVQAAVRVTPADFDFERFASVVLRAAGMRNLETVQQLAQRPTTVPALLSGYLPRRGFLGAREVELPGGPATVIEEITNYDPLVARLTLLWKLRDRIYLLTGVPESRPHIMSYQFAGVLTSAIALARTIE